MDKEKNKSKTVEINTDLFSKKNKYTGEISGRRQFISTTTIYNGRNGNPSQITKQNFLNSNDGTEPINLGSNFSGTIDETTDVLYVTKTLTRVASSTKINTNETSLNKYIDSSNDNDFSSFYSTNHNENHLLNKNSDETKTFEFHDYDDEQYSSMYKDLTDFKNDWESKQKFENTNTNNLNDILQTTNNEIEISSKEDQNFELSKTMTFGIDPNKLKHISYKAKLKFEDLNEKYKKCVSSLNHLINVLSQNNYNDFEYSVDKVRTENEEEMVKIKYDFRIWVDKQDLLIESDLIEAIEKCITRLDVCKQKIDKIVNDYEEFKNQKRTSNTLIKLESNDDKNKNEKRKKADSKNENDLNKKNNKKWSTRKKIIIFSLIAFFVLIIIFIIVVFSLEKTNVINWF